MSFARRLFLILLLAFASAAALPTMASAQTPPPVTAADRVLGRADAPVTVIEYASFTCPHCAHWFNDVFPAFKARFIDTGRVRLVFRDLPTNPQQLSVAAAIMGRCAAPGRFFDVATSFFGGQAALETGGSRPWFDNAIAASGKTREEIQACFTAPGRQEALNTDVNAAITAGITSTPAFFVNGKPLAGDPNIEALATAIGAAAPGR